MNLSEGRHRLKLKEINDFIVDLKNENPLNLQILDLVLTHSLTYSCVTINRTYFTNDCDRLKLGFGIELWRGAYSSVRPSEIGLTWNIDVANTAFFKSVDLLDLACEHYQCNEQQLKGAIVKDLRNNEIGASFLTSYLGRKIKTQTGFKKKICGFGPDSHHKFEFTAPGKPPQKISINEYLALQYKIKLK